MISDVISKGSVANPTLENSLSVKTMIMKDKPEEVKSSKNKHRIELKQE